MPPWRNPLTLDSAQFRAHPVSATHSVLRASNTGVDRPPCGSVVTIRQARVEHFNAFEVEIHRL